ncbi:DUF5602 domain-containing protein [Methanosarcina hadiensis]|uniref:DUF5602 domain-containing protein n=1 Tax=Methanosarcina hadiensis TaxID=3078083 RepID=UPI003977E033
MRKTGILGIFCILILSTTVAYGYVEECSQAGVETQTEKTQSLPETCTGESREVGNGIAYSWVTLNAEGNPSAIGVNLTESALSCLPEGEVAEYILPLPEEASATPYNHIGLDWNPKGHEPQEIYDKPHFDVHFYMMGQEEREKITATGEDMARIEKKPGPEYIPEGYISTPGGVPWMGAHWIDPSSPEFNGQPFEETFIYGFYNGEMVFVEPMVTVEYLKTKPELTKQLKLPGCYPISAYYPISYSIRYNETTKEWTIALEGMTPR